MRSADTKPHALMTLFTLLVLIFTVPAGASQSSPQPSAEQPRAADQELINAQKANESAQAEYYRELTKKLHEPSPTPIMRKTFSENVAENPASVIGIVSTILAALFAALVGLTTLFVNSRSAAKAQRDTQFYEALKRLGDKDSPTIRSSAAGLLAQMAQTKDREVTGFELRIRSYLPKKKKPFVEFDPHFPYFTTARDQLLTALLLEENPVALISIADSIRQLISYDTKKIKMMTEKLYEANLRIQEDLCSCLARLFVVNGHKTAPNPEHVDQTDKAWGTWRQAESLTGYSQSILRDFVSARSSRRIQLRAGLLSTYPPWHSGDFVSARSTSFAETFANHLHALEPNAEDNKGSLFAVAQDKLRLTSNRLRTNVDLYCVALPQFSREHPAMRRALLGSFLVGAYLSNADLSSVDLSYSQLNNLQLYGANMEGATFRDSNLRGACLSQSHLHNACLQEANLEGAELQNADLSETLLGLATIDDGTDLEGAKWWKSEFGQISDDEANVDTNLFERLFERYGEFVPTELSEVHSSIRDPIENKRKTVTQAGG